MIKVRKRDGTVVDYDASRITNAMLKAFSAVAEETATHSSLGQTGQTVESENSVANVVEEIARHITAYCNAQSGSHSIFDIEKIQELVENGLMDAKQHDVARAYIRYRAERQRIREEYNRAVIKIKVRDAQHRLKSLDEVALSHQIKQACKNLSAVSAEKIHQETYRNLFDGIAESEIIDALIIATRTLVEQDPEYSKVAARFLHEKLRREVSQKLNLNFYSNFNYVHYFKSYIKKAVELNLLDPRLLQFNLDKIAAALTAERDDKFNYLGLQTIYDRYLIRHDTQPLELPQALFMRVAMGLFINQLNQPNIEETVIAAYGLLSNFLFMCSTPTLFNSGTPRSQCASCFVFTVEDSLSDIFDSLGKMAQCSKRAGGIGVNYGAVRGEGSLIKGTNGYSNGVPLFLNVVNAMTIAVNQGGKRDGATCVYLPVWHRDIEAFLELRKNTGDDRLRTHDMNTAIWVSDLFMERVFTGEEWTLFSPDQAPLLDDLYGENFKQAYLNYEQDILNNKITNYKKIPALTLWRKILSMLHETGHPWITFKDPCNLRSPQQHCGVVHSSNLCTEIVLNTSKDEVAVCNLGSVILPNHFDEEGNLDKNKLRSTIRMAIRMLNQVIDINYYPVEETRNSNHKHRPIGLGIAGFIDCLYLKKIPHDSDEAVNFADELQEQISYYAIEASADLAQEQGSYESFKGSLWSQGILPIDSLEILAKNRPAEYLNLNYDRKLNWDDLRKKVKQGMRNSNVMAIAPTATIANICGVFPSIDPIYQNLYVKSNLSGEFTVINPWLVKDLKSLNLWDTVMLNDLKYSDGSIQDNPRIPEHIKRLYRTAFELNFEKLVYCVARLQKWVDQSISFNIYLNTASGKKIDLLYRLVFLLGLKTTYYFRSKAASGNEKSTTKTKDLSAVKAVTRANNSCNLEEGCTSCE